MTTQVRKNVMDMFIDGARRGFTIATTNLLPNVVMAFVIIQALKITGLLDPVQNVGRCLGTAEVNAKYYPHIITVCVINALLSIWVMQLIV